MESNFKERYKKIDNYLASLGEQMQPKNKRSEEEVAEASILYHEACAKRWKIRKEEIAFNKWVKEQK